MMQIFCKFIKCMVPFDRFKDVNKDDVQKCILQHGLMVNQNRHYKKI